MASDELRNRDGFPGKTGDCNGIVLVHDGPAYEARAARLLSWYDAATSVAPHEERCPCSAVTGMPDPRCSRCLGRGRYLAMSNPDAKFTSAALVATWPHWPVAELAELVAGQCEVLVTPDGEWHERGRQSRAEWLAEAFYLLADHAHFAALGYRFALVSGT